MNRVRLGVQGALAALALGGSMFFAPTAASASALTNCSTSIINSVDHVNVPAGSFVCEYGWTSTQWADGHRQIFLVGTDSTNSVFDSYEYSSGSNSWSNWRNDGGTGRSSVYILNRSGTGRDATITIEVWGDSDDLGYWCKKWTATSGWTGWWDC